jgi:hypothetical protein
MDRRHFLPDGRYGLRERVVRVAKSPFLSGLEGAYHRVVGASVVLGSVLVRGVVATTDVSARKTEPQVDPFVAGLETFLASMSARRNAAFAPGCGD